MFLERIKPFTPHLDLALNSGIYSDYVAGQWWSVVLYVADTAC